VGFAPGPRSYRHGLKESIDSEPFPTLAWSFWQTFAGLMPQWMSYYPSLATWLVKRYASALTTKVAVAGIGYGLGEFRYDEDASTRTPQAG